MSFRKDTMSPLRNNLIYYLLIIFSIFLINIYTIANNKVYNSIEKAMIPEGNYMPEGGYIADAYTAIKVAEAVWLPIYGNMIYESWPFAASLVDDSIWVVQGTMPKLDNGGLVQGGVPYAMIDKMNGKIEKIIHTK